MPFLVGLALIGVGGLFVWGGISGRFADMAAAFLPPTVKTASFTSQTPGFDQLGITSGNGSSPAGSNGSATIAPTPLIPNAYLVPNLSIDPTTGQPTGNLPNIQALA